MSDIYNSFFELNMNSPINEDNVDDNNLGTLEFIENANLDKGSYSPDLKQNSNLEILERNIALNSPPQIDEVISKNKEEIIKNEEEKNQRENSNTILVLGQPKNDSVTLQINEPISPFEISLHESSQPSNSSLNSEIISTEGDDISVLIQRKRINEESSYFISKKSNNPYKPLVTCKCYNSGCMKKYCACYKKGLKCIDCKCKDCKNNDIYIRKLICPDNYPELACAKENTFMTYKGVRGCLCDKTKCIKNYCHCFQNGKYCQENCFCTLCKNKPSNKKKEL